MLRSHRPRGSFWTAASGFQESKQFRQIDYEDCTAPVAMILAGDADEQLPTSQRAAKRQRIERIAHDFMIGEPIRLETTAFRPHRIRTVMERNRWISTEQSCTLTNYYEDESPNDLWLDLDHEFPAINCGPIQENPKDALQGHRSFETVSDDSSFVADIGTEASGSSVLQCKSSALKSRPSPGTLQKAAALRPCRQSKIDRRLHSRKLQMNATARPTGQLMSPPRQSNVNVARKRRKTTRDSNDEDSGDELRLSRLDALSTLHATTFSPRHLAVSTDANSVVHGSVSALSSGVEHRSNSFSASSPSHAERLQERESIPIVASTEKCTGCHSYDKVCSRRRHSAPGILPQDFCQKRKISFIPPHRASKFVPVAEVPEYIAAAAPSDGSTPFMYRKRSRRRKRASESATLIGMPDDLPGMQKSLSFQSDDKVTKTTDVVNVHSIAAETSLIDAHVNTEFTATAGSADARSFLRKALRREMRNSGATITDADGNVPRSSPDSIQRENDQCHGTARRGQTSCDVTQSTWLGTQKMLQQVERELFTSPSKPQELEESNSNSNDHERLVDYTEAREPLHELSQAPEESIGTQTLVETWSPWSTVKKPHFGLLAKAPAVSPCLEARGSAPRAHDIVAGKRSPVAKKTSTTSASHHSDHSDLFTINNTRSASSIAPLGDSTSKLQPYSGTDDHKSLATKSNMAGPSAVKHSTSSTATLHDYIVINKDVRHVQSEPKTTTTPIGIGQSLSSYEAARRTDSESQLSGIINDLTTSLLSNNDMDGLLGEV